MVSRQQKMPAYRKRLLAFALVVSFVGYGLQEIECQPCLAGDAPTQSATGKSATSKLVIVLPTRKPNGDSATALRLNSKTDVNKSRFISALQKGRRHTKLLAENALISSDTLPQKLKKKLQSVEKIGLFDTGQEILPISSEELSAPEQVKSLEVVKEQPQLEHETLAPAISDQSWASGGTDVDVKIINEISADVSPRLSDKSNSGKDKKSSANKMPKNFAVTQQGLFGNAPEVGVGGRRFEVGNLALWAAPNFHHRPLYFEEPNLERYGQYVGGPCIQSAVSAAHFFGRIPLLPYKIGANPPHSRNYTLGRYRPGNCNPRRVEVPEFSSRGLLYQGLFTTGAVFVVP